MTYEFSGLVENHKTYGLQLKVETVGLHVPSNGKGIEKFLLQNYKGIGKKAAEKIVTYFSKQSGGLDQFRSDLLANPYSMDFSVAGIKRKTSMDGSQDLKGLIYMDIATKIGGVELGDKLLRKIAGHLEDDAKKSANPIEKAWSILTSNPYALIRTLDGYAFRTADIIARKLNFDMNRIERRGALVTFAVTEGCNSTGHSFLTMGDFNKIISKIDNTVDVSEAIQAAIEMEEPLIQDHGRFYVDTIFQAERSLAWNLAQRCSRHLRSQIHNGSDQDVRNAIDDAESKMREYTKNENWVLDDSQWQCIYGLLTSFEPVHTITAGPGCGKTAIMELVVQILEGRTKHVNNPETNEIEVVPYKVGFCAPTGKAAKVLNARIKRFGAISTTIHTLLGVRGSKEQDDDGNSVSGMFMHNHNNRLDLDLLIVDETSMIDVALMGSLVSAMRDDAHIVFLGDPKQLPSVSPGACLANFLEMPFDHHELTSTHRSDGGILEVVRLAGLGRVDFVQRPDVEFIDGLPPASDESIERVLDLYCTSVDSNLGDFSKVGLLIARRKGDPNSAGWNSTYLNAVLRERYNPELVGGVGVRGIEGLAHANVGQKVFGTRYRVGDRVIIRKNLVVPQGDDDDAPVEQVVNGDTGSITDYIAAKGDVTYVALNLDDGRSIVLPVEHMDVLDFCYAMTVHSSQGSEYNHIIFINVNGHSSFVHRGIAFTGFSRAKRKLTVIGDFDAIRSVVARKCPERNSYLVQRFFRHLEKAKSNAHH
ncbi:putative helicase domain protein [Rhodoferax antarcticus ANT.BR]|uniref:Putative helicase domain protein n=2 Tax=Rhodoferax antarcticus TaxID=81479 RepID=A0A1Q8Y9D3_9BURK|nr:putative helicase domain protein [Rhodoferax antarcticus ANT.BR]